MRKERLAQSIVGINLIKMLFMDVAMAGCHGRRDVTFGPFVQ